MEYAHDAIEFADSVKGLQPLITRITEISQFYGLDLITKQTKHPIFNRQTLALMLTVSGLLFGMKKLIATASIAFMKRGTVFRSRHLPQKNSYYNAILFQFCSTEQNFVRDMVL